MSPATMPAYAAAACQEYDHWAGEVARLTAEIADITCPREVEGEESHFREASRVQVPAGPLPDHGSRPLFLHEVRERVKACPQCDNLAATISARRHARKRWGVSKRKVRHAGKLASGANP